MEEESEKRALSKLFALTTAFQDTMLLRCAVQLGLADIIQAHTQHNTEGITLTQLAESLPFDAVHVENLGRLMRWMVHIGLFAKSSTGPQGQEDLFKLTLASEFILKDGKKSILPAVVLMTDERTVSPWHYLDAAVECGSNKNMITPFEKKHGCDLWETLSQQPMLGKMFHDFIAAETGAMMPGVLKVCEGAFRRIGSIVDVGGSMGIAASRIAAEFPHMKCSVLDRPEVVAGIIVDCPDRVELIPGDMFSSIPYADALFLKKILHDWGDKECAKILHRCKEALPKEGGVLILVEIVMDLQEEMDGDEDAWCRTKMTYDLGMMVFTGGKERTAEEWKVLLASSGFDIYKITPIMGGNSVIEAHPLP